MQWISCLQGRCCWITLGSKQSRFSFPASQMRFQKPDWMQSVLESREQDHRWGGGRAKVVPNYNIFATSLLWTVRALCNYPGSYSSFIWLPWDCSTTGNTGFEPLLPTVFPLQPLAYLYKKKNNLWTTTDSVTLLLHCANSSGGYLTPFMLKKWNKSATAGARIWPKGKEEKSFLSIATRLSWLLK